MHGTGFALGNATFALRQIFGDNITDAACFIVCVVFGWLMLLEGSSRMKAFWASWRAGFPRLRYENDGREGYVHYENGPSRFRMYWAFGGGRALAIIDVPTEEEWVARTGLPLAERAGTLRFIATQVIRDQTSTGRNGYEIEPGSIVILA